MGRNSSCLLALQVVENRRLLRMIAGLEDISEGEFKIDDRVVNDVAPKDRDIAMVLPKLRTLSPHDSL